jgi:aerobic-type carbon monoxide dehydrogenase small subunit (CoxS/CutS family)
MILEIYVNGEFYHEEVTPDRRLLDFLRDDLGLMGTKKGCDQGECGACSVIVNQKIVNSCLVLVAQLPGNGRVITIESNEPIISALKEAFVEHGAIQCGACTPGMIMASAALLLNNPNPSSEEIRVGLSGVLCRCGCYPKILKAVESVRDSMGGGSRCTS